MTTSLRRNFYSRAWLSVDGMPGTQDGGDAPAVSLLNPAHDFTGWLTGDAADAFGSMTFHGLQTVFTPAHVAASPSPSNAFRTPKSITGSFVGGTFDFYSSVSAIKATGTISGKMHFNLWRGVSPLGVDAVQINVADIIGNEVTSLAVSTPQSSNAGSTIAGFDLLEEYLFLVLEWEATAPGAAGDGVRLQLGGLTSWKTSLFTLPNGTAVPQYEEIDWGGNGFDSNLDPDVNAYSDVSSMSRGVSTSRGMNYQAQEVPKAETGRLTSILNNPQAIYARQNEAGPLFGHLKPKLSTRARITAPVDRSYFTGQVDSLVPGAAGSETPTASLAAYTDFIEFQDNSKVTPDPVAAVTTDVAYNAVLDQVQIRGVTGWPEAKRRIATGDVTVGLISPVDESPESIIDRITQNELGRAYPGAAGEFVAENRNYRRDTTRSQEVQITFSDDPEAVDLSHFYGSIKLENPSRLHYDRVAVDFTPTFQLDGSPTLLFGVARDGLGEVGGIHIGPGQSRIFTINPFVFPWVYPIGAGTPAVTANSGPDAPGSYVVTEWEPLTTEAVLPALPSIRITVDAGLASPFDATVSAVKTTAHSITFTVTNSNATLIMEVFEILLRGKRAVLGAPVKQVAGSGTHEYPLPGKDYPDSAASLLAANWLYRYLSPDRDWITITVPCQGMPDLLALMMGLEISDRIRGLGTRARTGLAMDQQFFVENIKWSCQAPGHFLATVLASGCLPNTQDDVTVETGLPTGLAIYYGMNESDGPVNDLLATHYNLDRIGTSVNVGVIGPGQEFHETESDQLVNITAGLPDDHLTDDWEWNGFIKPATHTGDDQIILQKAVGDPGSYALQLTNIGANQFLQGSVLTSDGLFTTKTNGLPLSPSSWHFVRLVHDSVGKRIGVSQDNGAMVFVTYTGTIIDVGDGIIFGSSGTLAASGFDYWFRATDLLDPGGSDVDLWPDRSGNGRDAATRSGTDVKIVDAQMNGKRIVRFNHGHLRFPEIALGPVQLFFLARINSQAFQGTIIRTSASAGPNYGLGIDENFGTWELSVHYYSHNNDDPVKLHAIVPGLPLAYAVYTITDDGTGGALALSINGIPKTLFSNGANWSGASGFNPDDQDQIDVFETIIAHDLDSTEITAVENAMMYEAGIGGSPGSAKSLNGGLDEFGFWAGRYLTDQEASDRYLNGAGSTVTGPGGNSVSPTQPSSNPVAIPTGGTANQPTAASNGQLYFNTDLLGGTLQQFTDGAWSNVAPGLLEDIPRAIVNAKGDLIIGTADNIVARLGVGTDGQVLEADSGASGGVAWADLPPPGIPEALIDATGDLIVGVTDDIAGRLGVGADGEVLTARSSETLGVAWETAASAGKYQALVYTSDGTSFEFIANGSGEPVYVLRDLE